MHAHVIDQLKLHPIKRYFETIFRYHDSVQDENHELDAVNITDRPIHCESTEVIAQSLRVQFSGFSVSSLQRWYHLSATTPPFSPTTLSLSSPSAVSATTLKYLKPFLRERNLQDAIPSSWATTATTDCERHLLRVPKQSIQMWDADSGEIRLSPSDTELASLATHGNTIRLRMLNSDSPETEYSMRIYKQSENSMEYHAFLTRHIGIECLRAARQMLFEAKEVFLQVDKDSRGRISAPLGRYGRRLVNIFLQNSEGEMENFAEKLASQGFTLSFYTTGIDLRVDQAMRKAMDEKKGMFSLPEEAFTYPFRPWDIRELTKKNGLSDYDARREILNKPSNPNRAWAPKENSAPFDGGESDDDIPESETTDNFTLKLVRCKLFWESRCFVAQSTIPNAGRGLFLLPHEGVIPVGTHLCIYAERSHTRAEIEASDSSRVYLIYVSRKNLLFDAENETGNNLGRFANQPGVLEAFHQIKELSTRGKPQITEDDWRKIECGLDEKCNATFDVVRDQLVLKVKREFAESREATEIFVNYGDMRDYWFPMIRARNTDDQFPRQMIDIFQWLMSSDECNWTDIQRQNWVLSRRIDS